MENLPEPKKFSARQCAELGIPYHGTPSVEEMITDQIGIATAIPDFFLHKFQELAGQEQLNGEDVAMIFRGFLSTFENPENKGQVDSILGHIVSSYIEFKKQGA